MALPDAFRVLDEEVVRVGGTADRCGLAVPEPFRMVNEWNWPDVLDKARNELDERERDILRQYLSGTPVQTLADQLGGNHSLLNVVRTTLNRLQRALA